MSDLNLSKTAGDKDKEDEAASNAANKEKSKEMSISIAPPMQPKTAGASEITETSEITGASEITETSEITGTSEIPGTSEVLATTPSQSSESDDNNFEVGHASETKSITQDNDEENEEIEEMIINEKNTSLAQVEEEDVDTMSIDSTLASDAIPTKKDLKGASRTTGGIFWGKAQGNNFRFADNMNESSSMVVNPQGFVYNTVSDNSPKFNPTLLNTETPPQAVPTTTSVKETVNFHLARSVGSSYGASTTIKSSENASASAATNENLDIPDGLTKKQELIIFVYKVDKSLLGHKNWSIQMAWKVYQEMWPSDMDKPIMKDLHTMFGAAGTALHHWDKVLKFVSNYPDMEEWLSTATPPDNKATHELWGLEKTAGFTRTDLENWIKKKKGISAGKGKQKAEGGKGKKGSGIKNNFLYICVWLLQIYYAIVMQYYWLIALAYLPMAYGSSIMKEMTKEELKSQVG
ncbi:hypothetical protein BDQ17DRAFT_1332911 [Cyathus striatus]|nr:hypothetical protein BDQ17DRAFT_1332911 [Cyathus striatus]